MMTNIIQKLFFPHYCLLCRERSGQSMDLCVNCRDALPYLKSACYRCANPITIDSAEKLLCPDCLKRMPYFDSSFALCHYQSRMSLLITRLKFQRQLAYGRVLADLMGEACGRLPRPDVLIPVPLHRRRLCERGFNQAIEIAAPLGKYLDIPVNRHGCRRIRDTQAQSTLAAKRRHANIKGAFAVVDPIPAHVAIIDDVVTTGHTVNELSRVLRQAGAEIVQVWSCARA
ncbi:MAG: ComF family protein [Pseudomonadota bacterium]